MLSFILQGHGLACGDGVHMEAGVGLVALIIALFGYRIYRVSLGACGALVACSFITTAGLAWYGGGDGSAELVSNDINSMSSNTEMSESAGQMVKLGVILFFCSVWSVMGALVCLKISDKVQKAIGFVSGAVLGMGLMALLVGLVSNEVGKSDLDIDDNYAGWETYIELAAGVPFSLIVGYVMRDMVAYVLMAITSLLGSFVGVCLSVHALQCLAEIEVHHRVTLGLALLFAVVAFGVQVLDFTMTRKPSGTQKEGLSSEV